MKRLVIVSNRLPVGIQLEDNNIEVKPNVGGLATGMRSVSKKYDSLWIGWSGLFPEELSLEMRKKTDEALRKEKCLPVYIGREEIEKYYNGFSNGTIWPLFHYFPQFTEYYKDHWEAYVEINQRFASVLKEHLRKDDVLWIHDYHLLLLPKLIKDEFPAIPVGFFLHIPFPSFEIFRILPWRQEIIEGMLGADLLGFHTFDYERHFLSSVRRLLGYEIEFNRINLRTRMARVDAFPMGIDYDRFHQAAVSLMEKNEKEQPEISAEIEKFHSLSPGRKLILSIDRLDYSKGIPNRLHAFEAFLEKYPQYRGKVTLVMLAVPSRDQVEQYQLIKKEVDELVGRINGAYATINWTPVWYFYRSLPFDELIDLYTSCDIGLLTPVRDGMNLVAKEFIATKTSGKGVLILSEMAGAAKEMGEAILINPNNREELADAIVQAIEMPEEEQRQRLDILQRRLRRYNIEKWAGDFMTSLQEVDGEQQKYLAKSLSDKWESRMFTQFGKAKKRIFFLDYDGTLVGFKKDPKMAFPDQELYDLLERLAKHPLNTVVLVSGRDKETFTEWFGDRPFTLIAEHGVWLKQQDKEWELYEQMNTSWKDLIRPGIEFYVDRTPGTFIEEKNYSMVWHYRKADPELGAMRALELKYELTSLLSNLDLEILEGNKVVEVKKMGINKGKAAGRILNQEQYDFIFGAGDDWTDEYLFEEMPAEAFTMKVGMINTKASYIVDSYQVIRQLLAKFVDSGKNKKGA